MKRRLAAAVGLAGTLVLLTASPAFAHAQLEQTDPRSGDKLEQPPEDVTLTFSEPVEASLGAIRVYDSQGDLVDAGEPTHPDGDQSVVRLELPDLEDGGYVTTWRVLSADAHPVHGAFTFRVGNAQAGDLQPLADRLLTDQGGSTSVGGVFGATRFIVFGSMALLLGGAAFVAWLWPRGRESKRAARIVWGAWAVLGVSTVAGILLQGPYTAALPLRDAFDTEVVRDTLDTRFGRVWVARLLLLVVVIPLLRLLLAKRPRAEYPLPTWWVPAAVVVGVALSFTPGLAGHANSGDLVPLAIPADAIHIAAMSLWLGGLVMLLAVVLPTRDLDDLRVAVPRYSLAALYAVSALVITGSFQAWRQVGGLEALRDTDYGRLLVIKLVAFAALLVAATFSREIVNRTFRKAPAPPAPAPAPVPVGAGGPARLDPPEPPAAAGVEEEVEVYDEADEARRLRWSVAVEVVVAVVILGVTALLVNAAPARDQQTGPVEITMRGDGMNFDIVVAPAEAGRNDVHLTATTPGGGPTEVLQMDARMSLPSRDIAPIKLQLRRLGPGHYTAPGVDLPISGDWQLEVATLISDTDEVRATGTIPIR
ncbi:MAG: FixH family protein [Acidimicrobiia bacterium]